jgi:hypothetical protein
LSLSSEVIAILLREGFEQTTTGKLLKEGHSDLKGDILTKDVPRQYNKRQIIKIPLIWRFIIKIPFKILKCV